MKELKQRLREEIKNIAKNFVDSGESKILCEKLKKTEEWKQAKHVLLYAPIQGEVGVLPLFDESKQFYFPRVNGEDLEVCEVTSLEDLERGSFKVLEPKKSCKIIAPELLDIILVPGLAFDAQGGRIGKGKGFYDRFLSPLQDAQKKTLFISIAFPFQIQKNIPRDAWDILIDTVIF